MQPLPARSSQALGGPLAPLTLAAAHRATASEAPNWVSVKGLKRMDRARLRTASDTPVRGSAVMAINAISRVPLMASRAARKSSPLSRGRCRRPDPPPAQPRVPRGWPGRRLRALPVLNGLHHDSNTTSTEAAASAAVCSCATDRTRRRASKQPRSLRPRRPPGRRDAQRS